MCGIAGLVDTSGRYSKSAVVSRMADTMIKRGPDGYGEFVDSTVAMAMRRLAVIDLAHGGQPFFSSNKQVVAFQNGEIYNFRELRRQLEQKGYIFVSHSDTEVLAHGFVQWGITGLLERIDGMYALAILDRRSKTLFLGRDRFGEKPLFYNGSKGLFAYASDLKALTMLPWVDGGVDSKSVDYYLALHYVPGDMTFFKSVRRVLPGEYIAVGTDAPEPRSFRYYRPGLGKTARTKDEELSGLVEKSVESRMVADVPVGVFLSGGLDSSLVAAMAANKQPHILTFSMGFESETHDERSAAALVAKSIGSRHHSFVFNDDSFISLLPVVAAALDEPIGDQAMLPLYWLCSEARKHVTVVLAGEGADEIFAGYSYYSRFLYTPTWREKLMSLLGRNGSRRWDLHRIVHSDARVTPSGFPLLTDGRTRRLLAGDSDCRESAWEKEVMQWLDTADGPLQRATAADLSTWLPDDLLVKFDRMAMAHSLEGRAPYLHPAVVEAGICLPQEQRMRDSASKIALRRIASKWLPGEIIEKPKQGFVLPMKKWLMQWFDVNGSVEEYFYSSNIDFLNIAETVRLVKEDVEQGVTNERFLFALVLLCEWFKSYRGALHDVRMREDT